MRSVKLRSVFEFDSLLRIVVNGGGRRIPSSLFSGDAIDGVGELGALAMDEPDA
jgi:hypothetical protein